MSSDARAFWVEKPENSHLWVGAASSVNGAKVVGAASDGYIWKPAAISSFTARIAAGADAWSAVAASGDGTRLIAFANGDGQVQR